MELISGNIKLRPLRLSEAWPMAELANNENIACNLRDGFPHPYKLADAENFLTKFTNQDSVTYFGIDFNEEYVGNI